MVGSAHRSLLRMPRRAQRLPPGLVPMPSPPSLPGGRRSSPISNDSILGDEKMKRVIAALLLNFLLLLGLSGAAVAGDTFVNGYVRRDGTYVQPHVRSAPDGNPWNN